MTQKLQMWRLPPVLSLKLMHCVAVESQGDYPLEDGFQTGGAHSSHEQSNRLDARRWLVGAACHHTLSDDLGH